MTIRTYIASSITDENLILFADATRIPLHCPNLKSLFDKVKNSVTQLQSYRLSYKLSLRIEKYFYIGYLFPKTKHTRGN